MLRSLMIMVSLALVSLPAIVQEPQWRREVLPDHGISGEFRGPMTVVADFDPDTEMTILMREGLASQGVDGAGWVGIRVLQTGEDVATIAQQWIDPGTQTPGNRLFDVTQREGPVGGRQGRIVDWKVQSASGVPVRNRLILAARGDLVLMGFYAWREGRPAGVERFTRSLRFDPVSDPGTVRSSMLLVQAINGYWGGRKSSDAVRFDPRTARLADRERAQTSQIVSEFGRIVRIEPARRNVYSGYDGWRVFRLHHEKAIVDWLISDDGSIITGLTHRLVSYN